MKQNITLKALLLTGTAALGLAVSALADTPAPAAPVAAPETGGLLGQAYAGLSYSYVHLDTAPVSADRYSFEYNQPLNAGFDAVFNYDRTQDGLLAGDRGYTQSFDAALRAFTTAYTWGKPYVEAGLGYDRTKYSGIRDSSLAWIAGAGVEFQVAPAVTVTPYIRYTRTNDLTDRNTADYGVKANYWLTRQWAVTGGVGLDDSRNVGYRLGVTARF